MDHPFIGAPSLAASSLSAAWGGYLRQHRWQACPRATVHLQLPGSKLPYGGFDLDMKPWWNSICQYLPYTSHVKMCKTFQKIIENLLPAPQENITKPGFHVLRAVRRRGSHYRRACRSCTRNGRATGRRRGVGRSGRFRLSDLLMVGICWYKHV